MEKSKSSLGSNKENSRAFKTPLGLLAKVCSKFLKSGQSARQAEKCEKCGVRSSTCRPNASFISGRKHFLCDSCRVSGNKMKNMYSQLSRNLSLRDTTSRTPTCLDSSDKYPASDKSLVRSRSLRVRPPAPESGYDTATSLSSCSNGGFSSCSNGRLSPDSVMSTGSAGHRSTQHTDDQQTTDNKLCKDSLGSGKVEVLSQAFTSQMDHLQSLALNNNMRPLFGKQQRTQHVMSVTKTNDIDKDNNTYDGYLENRGSNSDCIKFVFVHKDSNEQVVDETGEDRLLQDWHSDSKVCYRCQQSSHAAFRAPFQRGWLCEDCMDDLL